VLEERKMKDYLGVTTADGEMLIDNAVLFKQDVKLSATSLDHCQICLEEFDAAWIVKNICGKACKAKTWAILSLLHAFEVF